MGTSSSSSSAVKHRKQQHQRGFVYCFQPHQCSCDKQNAHNNDINESKKFSSPSSLSPSPSPSSVPELVHLPVPYNIRPESYFEQQQGDDDGHDLPLMKYDPFFHEISDDNRCVGNMLLTPFGKNEVQQMLLEDNASSSNVNSNKRRKKEV